MVERSLPLSLPQRSILHLEVPEVVLALLKVAFQADSLFLPVTSSVKETVE